MKMFRKLRSALKSGKSLFQSKHNVPRLFHPRLEPLEDRRLLSVSSLDQAIEVLSVENALFAENAGQWSSDEVYFGYNNDGTQIYFTDDSLRFNISRTVDDGSQVTDDVVDSDLLDGDEATEVESTQFSLLFDGAQATTPTGADIAETVFNYHVGEEENWVDGVATYTTVLYSDLYDGVDLYTYGQSGQMKYEFHVSPGSDYTQIQLSYDGIEGLSIGDGGSLHITTSLGEIVDEDLYIYQIIDGEKVEVAGDFVLLDNDTYTFVITGDYNPTAELIIDPNLDWGTYLGGSSDDRVFGVSTDASGNVLVVGFTVSSDWVSGGWDTSLSGGDGFVVKLNSSGAHLWSTYLGGSDYDSAGDVSTDASGNVYVCGRTGSSGWVSGGYDTEYGGSTDGFVVKLSSTGSHLWSTYLGGSDIDSADGISTDASGNVYVCGYTQSSDWISGGWDTSLGGSDGFVVKLNSSGAHLWSTYLGGSDEDHAYDLSTDAPGNVLVTGYTESSGWVSGGYDTEYGGSTDGFVVKLSSTGSHLWSTYLGGSDIDCAHGISTDASGNVYVCGYTYSSGWVFGGWNTSLGGIDGFVVKLNSSGAHLWSTYLGGSDYDSAGDVSTDASGNVYVCGRTGSSGWVSGGYDTEYGGSTDGFVVKLSSTGSHLWSTYLGGSDYDYAGDVSMDVSGNVYVCGNTFSSGWLSGGWDASYGGNFDGFIVKINGLASADAAIARQLKKTSTLTFDGTGNDLELELAYVDEGQQVEVWVGLTTSDLRSLGIFTNTSGESLWTLSVDISAASLDSAQYVAVTSADSLTIVSATALHPDISDWVGYTEYPSTETEEPSLTIADYTLTTQLYYWDCSTKSFVAWVVGNDTIDWSKQTIILTHGWNDSYQSAFITEFAEDFMSDRTEAESTAYNILAVDWYNDGSANGSDPNGNSNDSLSASAEFYADAQQSAENGILSGAAIAKALVLIVGDDLNPENIMLIGHSNGAGFMASMALTLYEETGKKVAELDALDAPVETASWSEVYKAAAAGIEVSNYYMNLTGAGFGEAIYVPGNDNVTNFQMDYSACLAYALANGLASNASDYLGHVLVALCYADTADNASPLISWGFRESEFFDGESCFDYCQFWKETDIPGYFIINTTQVLADVITDTQTYWDSITSQATSIWDTVTSGAASAVESLLGLNTTVRASDDYATIYAQAHSPVVASLEVVIPTDADLLEFTLSVTNSGNNDYVLVAIGDDVLQKIDLAEVQTAGGLKSQLWMQEYAGQTTTITFYMPSEESSTAEFVISDINFLEVNLPPQATVNLDSFVVQDSIATFTVTYTDADGTISESTIDDNDILVTGPNDYSQYAVRVNAEASENNSTITATYQIAANGTAWTSSDSGTYLITMQADQVSDAAGSYVAAGEVGFFTLDKTLPKVTGVVIDNGTTQRSTIRSLQFMFSEDVFDSLTVDDLHVVNITTGEEAAVADMTLTTDADTLTATWTFTGLSGGKLTEGNYMVTLGARDVLDVVGNAMAEDYVVEFGVLYGDATGDGQVNAVDLLKVRKNYLKEAGNRDECADVNGDGNVNALDLLMVRKNYLNSLETPFDLVVSDTDIVVPEEGTVAFTVALSTEPSGTVEVTVAFASGDEDLSVQSGAILTFDSTNWDTPQTVTLAAAADLDATDGVAQFAISAANARGTMTVSATENDDDQALLAASVSISETTVDTALLTQSALEVVVDAAVARWSSAGLNEETLMKLQGVRFVIANLGGNMLGLTSDSVVVIDDDAAGNGWYVDPTPLLDEGYMVQPSGSLKALPLEMAHHMDLLTTVEHEIGHILGLDDLDAASDSLMDSLLPVGVRRNVGHSEIDALFANDDLLDKVLVDI